MIEIGKLNKLKIVKESELGIYLDAEKYGELLLPTDQVPADYKSGESLEVFLYYDSEGRILPTTKKPYATVGEFSCLKVIDTISIGAFLDWGMPKDLFVPISEQKEVMKKEEFYVVYIYRDERRNRVAASTKLDTFLDKEPAVFKENDKVDLLICNQTNLGYNAIINNSHWGLLYKDEVFQELNYGQKIEGYIKNIREDEKIDLTLQLRGYRKMEDLEKRIITQINEKGGVLTITDKSSPQMIYEQFGVSKKKYKMALGSLYKAKRIIIEDDAIRIN